MRFAMEGEGRECARGGTVLWSLSGRTGRVIKNSGACSRARGRGSRSIGLWGAAGIAARIDVGVGTCSSRSEVQAAAQGNEVRTQGCCEWVRLVRGDEAVQSRRLGLKPSNEEARKCFDLENSGDNWRADDDDA